MKKSDFRADAKPFRSRALASAAALALLPAASALATSIRVATYNVDFSDQGNNNNAPAVDSAVEAMGQHHINGNAQPVDVIGLEELLDTNNNSITSTSLPAMVTALNTFYGAGTYAYDTTPDPTGGGTQYDGPSGLIYNTKTVKIVAVKALAYGGSTNIPRAPIRYLIQPLGYGSGAQFYMYASHYKSGSGTANATTRNNEATEIRADADALGANAHILYTGDHNLYGASSEPSYQTLVSAGNGQAHDPNSLTQVWGEDAANVSRLTGDSTGIQYAEDLELTSSAIYNQAGTYTTPGLRLASSGGVNSYIVFGNGSSPSVPTGGTAQPFQGSVNYAGNLSLSDLPNASTVLANLTTASDHVPVVADFTLVGVTQLPAIWNGGTGNWSTAATWSTTQSPNNATVEVQVDNGNAAASIVTLDQNALVGDIVLNSGDTLNTNAATTLTISGPTATTLAGKFNATGGVVVQGNVTNSGTFILSGSQNWSSGTVFTNTAGTATFNSDAGSAGANLSVNVSGGAVTFAAVQHLANLNVGSGGLVTITGGGNGHRSMLYTPLLTVLGTLDLTNNDLDVQGGDLAATTTLIKKGFNANGQPGSTGITSSSATSDTTHLTAIGVILNNAVGTTPIYTMLDGAAVALNDVLVKYTYFGDTDLNGKVDGTDYSRIDSAFVTGNMTGWYNGDFNYDNVINGSDYTLIDNAFNTQRAVLTSIAADPTASITSEIETGTSVPEPTSSATLFIAAVSLLRRRKMKVTVIGATQSKMIQ